MAQSLGDSVKDAIAGPFKRAYDRYLGPKAPPKPDAPRASTPLPSAWEEANRKSIEQSRAKKKTPTRPAPKRSGRR